jgi:hypothetical protein
MGYRKVRRIIGIIVVTTKKIIQPFLFSLYKTKSIKGVKTIAAKINNGINIGINQLPI